MKKVSLGSCSVLAALFVFSVPVRAENLSETSSAHYAPVFSLRTSNGMLTNTGTSGGSSVSFAGLNVSTHFFLDGQTSFGLGYKSEFDFQKQSIPISGLFLTGRRYFRGQGTRSTIHSQEMVTERQDNLAYYWGAEVARMNYYVGANRSSLTAIQQTGDYIALAASVGGNYRIRHNVDLTGELSYGLMSFAASDDRISIKGTALLMGINYVW